MEQTQKEQTQIVFKTKNRRGYLKFGIWLLLLFGPLIAGFFFNYWLPKYLFTLQLGVMTIIPSLFGFTISELNQVLSVTINNEGVIVRRIKDKWEAHFERVTFRRRGKGKDVMIEIWKSKTENILLHKNNFDDFSMLIESLNQLELLKFKDDVMVFERIKSGLKRNGIAMIVVAVVFIWGFSVYNPPFPDWIERLVLIAIGLIAVVRFKVSFSIEIEGQKLRVRGNNDWMVPLSELVVTEFVNDKMTYKGEAPRWLKLSTPAGQSASGSIMLSRGQFYDYDRLTNYLRKQGLLEEKTA